MGKKESRKSPDGLTVRERQFCHHFIIHQKGAQALKEAGYNFEKNTTAQVYLNKLLNMERIKKYLGILAKKIQGESEEVAEQAKKVLAELDILCFSDPLDYFNIDDKGNLSVKSLSQMGKGRKAISKIKQTISGSKENPTRVLELGFHGKNESLKLLGEHHKLYTQMVRHSGEVISPTIYKLPDDGTSQPPED